MCSSVTGENLNYEAVNELMAQESNFDDELNSTNSTENYSKEQVIGFLGCVRSYLLLNAPELVDQCLTLENEILYKDVKIEQSSMTDLYNSI